MESLGQEYIQFNLQNVDPQDYEIYIRMYDEFKQRSRKPRSQATIPGKIEHHGPPLDFSFLKLQDVQSLRKENPRSGVRKPIEKDDEEEDGKDNYIPNAVNGDDKFEGDKPKDVNQVYTVRNTSVPAINDILQKYTTSLQNTKPGMVGARKTEDGKEEA